MSRTFIAKENLSIVERGVYRTPSGRQVDVRDLVEASIAGTRLYRPDAFPAPPAARPGQPRIEVTGETTSAAGRRLAGEESRVLALNFASAKNAGGGFLRGAKAQEEDLCRSSALYNTLITQPDYYAVHRASTSMLYSDHMIYSPDVPFFRGEKGELLDEPFALSILTSPAPNAGEVERHGGHESAEVEPTLRARAAKILAVAAAHGHRCLVLGAWGCGVFRNDPARVASAFAVVREDPWRGAFDRVVFAVYERDEDGPNRAAFVRAFGS